MKWLPVPIEPVVGQVFNLSGRIVGQVFNLSGQDKILSYDTTLFHSLAPCATIGYNQRRSKGQGNRRGH